ncbi:actin, partial [Reticulomyxa filosa]
MTTLVKSFQRQKNKEIIEQGTINKRLIQQSKNKLVIAWQVCGPHRRAQDWIIGKKLTERGYSFTATTKKEIARTLMKKYPKADTSGDLEQKYEFPDGQVITVEYTGDVMRIDDAAVDHNPPKQAIKFTDWVFVENYPGQLKAATNDAKGNYKG